MSLLVAEGLLGHLLFEVFHQLAQGEGEAQIDRTDNDQGLQLQEGSAGDHLVGGHQIAQEEGGSQGSLFQDHNKLIAQCGENVADCLRQDDLHHSLALAHTQASRGFGLTLIHGLDTGADNLGNLIAGVDAHCDCYPHELTKVQEGKYFREHKIEDVQLQQNGSAADHFNIDAN